MVLVAGKVGAAIVGVALIISPLAAFSDASPRKAGEFLSERCDDHRQRIAIIGDFGVGTRDAAAVAKLVEGWNVDFVATLGDNNYPTGSRETLDRNVGRLYGEFLGNDRDKPNRFFPALGNHDWMDPDRDGLPAPYLEYFSLPGNERYYRVARGAVELFVLDSDSREPDGITVDSAQAQWLRDGLAASKAAWKWVILHHPPYSSSLVHGSNSKVQWPFRPWGADIVMSGHDHAYERLEIGGLTYIVNGLGGSQTYFYVGNGLSGSLVRYNKTYGAMLACADEKQAAFAFINIKNEVIDQFDMNKTTAP